MAVSAHDVTVQTRFADAQALMSIVSIGIARGALRLPAQIALGPTFEVSLVTAAGEVAVRGTAEAIRHDGAMTLVRFLSATEGGEDQDAWVDLEDAVVTVPAALVRRMLPAVPPLSRPQRRIARERGDWSGAVGTPLPADGDAAHPPRAVPPAHPPSRTSTVRGMTRVPSIPPIPPVPRPGAAYAPQAPQAVAVASRDDTPVPARDHTPVPAAATRDATPARVATVVREDRPAPAAAPTSPLDEAWGTAIDQTVPGMEASPALIEAALFEAAQGEDPSWTDADAMSSDDLPLPPTVFPLPPGATITIPPPVGGSDAMGAATTIALPRGASITMPPPLRSTTIPPPLRSTTMPPPLRSSTIPPALRSSTIPPALRSSTIPPPSAAAMSSPFGVAALSTTAPIWTLPDGPAPTSRAARGVLGASVVIAVAGAAVAVSAVLWARSVSSTQTAPPPGAPAASGPIAAAGAVAQRPAAMPTPAPREPAPKAAAVASAPREAAPAPIAAPTAVAAASPPADPIAEAASPPSRTRAEAIAPRNDAIAPREEAIAAPAKGACRAEITSNAAGAAIFIDGARRGQTPATLALPCAPATLVLRHPRYQELSRRIEPAADGAAVAAAMIRPKAQLKIVSRPSGAVVMLGRRPVGKTPLTVTVDGYERQSVTMTAPGYAPEHRSVYVRGDASVVAATLRRK